jgi:uncharacterized protein YcfJ
MEQRPYEGAENSVVSETAGGISGGLAGAAIGALAGPVGAIVGAIAGIVSGWWAGHAIADAARQYDTVEDAKFRREHTGPTEYDEIRPAYQIGYLAGSNPDWDEQTFDQVEPTLAQGWHNVRDRTGEWIAVRDYARTAFDRARTERR